jgi:hypothetical protein
MHFTPAICKIHIIPSLVINFLEENKNVILKDFIPNVSQNSIATSAWSFHKHLTFKISIIGCENVYNSGIQFSRMSIFVYNCIYTLNLLIFFLNPVTGLEWPRGFQEVKVPKFYDNGTGCGKVVSLTHRKPLPPGKYTWYSFLLEAESTPGPKCDR